MIRRTILVAAVPLALLAGACSKTETTTNAPATTTTKAGAATTVAGASSTVAKQNPTVTKPEKIEKIDKSKLPAKTQNAKLGTSITEEEQDCINSVIYETVQKEPAFADDEAILAFLSGKSITLCVSAEKVGTLLTEDMAGKATDSQIACVKAEFVAADGDSMAAFLGALAMEDKATLKAVGDALDQKCGTTLAKA